MHSIAPGKHSARVDRATVAAAVGHFVDNSELAREITARVTADSDVVRVDASCDELIHIARDFSRVAVLLGAYRGEIYGDGATLLGVITAATGFELGDKDDPQPALAKAAAIAVLAVLNRPRTIATPAAAAESFTGLAGAVSQAAVALALGGGRA